MNHKNTNLRSGLVGLLLLGLGAASLYADAVVTLSGKRVEGTIVEETEEYVLLETPDYGQLRFRRIDLQRVERPGQQQSSGSSNDIFGSAGSSSGILGEDVFGGQNPGDSVEIPAGTPMPPLGERQSVTPPAVPTTWDAVLFDLPPEGQVEVKAQPSTPEMIQVSAQTLLRNGAEIKTGDSPVRVVFKNGSDTIRIAPYSQIALQESSPEAMTIRLRRGSVWGEMASGIDGQRTLSVFTAHAVVQADSQSVFRVADALDRGYHVSVVEGTAAAKSLKAQIATDVPAGEMLLVRPNGAMTPLRGITRPIRKEDVLWNELDSNWWFQTERLGIGSESPEEIQLISINELQDHLRQVGNAFLRVAEDTGHVPTTEEAFSLLRQNRSDLTGWNGPYWDGLLPPLDSWGRPIRYTTRSAGSSGRIVGIVYSTGEDNYDNNGDPSADVTEMVLYYQLDVVSTDGSN